MDNGDESRSTKEKIGCCATWVLAFLFSIGFWYLIYVLVQALIRTWGG